jgi:hypothetical protein
VPNAKRPIISSVWEKALAMSSIPGAPWPLRLCCIWGAPCLYHLFVDLSSHH